MNQIKLIIQYLYKLSITAKVVIGLVFVLLLTIGAILYNLSLPKVIKTDISLDGQDPNGFNSSVDIFTKLLNKDKLYTIPKGSILEKYPELIREQLSENEFVLRISPLVFTYARYNPLIETNERFKGVITNRPDYAYPVIDFIYNAITYQTEDLYKYNYNFTRFQLGNQEYWLREVPGGYWYSRSEYRDTVKIAENNVLVPQFSKIFKTSADKYVVIGLDYETYSIKFLKNTLSSNYDYTNRSGTQDNPVISSDLKVFKIDEKKRIQDSSDQDKLSGEGRQVVTVPEYQGMLNNNIAVLQTNLNGKVIIETIDTSTGGYDKALVTTEKVINEANIDSSVITCSPSNNICWLFDYKTGNLWTINAKGEISNPVQILRPEAIIADNTTIAPSIQDRLKYSEETKGLYFNYTGEWVRILDYSR